MSYLMVSNTFIMLRLKSISSTCSGLGCSTLPVTCSLDSGIIMILFRLLEVFLNWRLPITSFKCSQESLGILVQSLLWLTVCLVVFLFLLSLRSPHDWSWLLDPFSPEEDCGGGSRDPTDGKECLGAKWDGVSRESQ